MINLLDVLPFILIVIPGWTRNPVFFTCFLLGTQVMKPKTHYVKSLWKMDWHIPSALHTPIH